ncbi:MAG: hypothetical protein L0Z50_36200 [Verrucomicrobiales bacterium]|nr:hypothetical protein [Verrucomicrobiales bacterium]
MQTVIKNSLALLTALAFASSHTWAAGSVKSTSDVCDVFTCLQAPEQGIVVGSSTLVRKPNGVSFTFAATGLPEGHAVTIWICIIRSFEPFVFDCLRGAGHIVGGGGTVHLAGALQVGDVSESISPLLGTDGLGLLDSYNEEIHLVLRDHGPADPGRIDEQIHSYEGDCGTCVDILCSIHVP